MSMNLSNQDLTAIKHLIDNSNLRLETRLSARMQESEKRLEKRLIARIDQVDYALTTYIDDGLQNLRKELGKDIKSITKTLQSA